MIVKQFALSQGVFRLGCRISKSNLNKGIRTVIKKSSLDQGDDSIRELSVRIPDRLAERLEAYTKQKNAEITQVVIESIDFFLRNQSKCEQ
jgi:hypothetical protein